MPVKPLQGLVNGGQSRAVVGALVYVFQASSSPNNRSSISLLTAATGNPRDSIGNYVLTNEQGGFSIAGDYTCTAGHQVYVYAKGGNSGGNGPNDAIGLMASLGVCPEAGNFDSIKPFIFVNEVTTVAAAYATADDAIDATHISGPSVFNVASGSVDASDLASVATGFANSTMPNTGKRINQSKIYTIANILAACVNSESPTSGACITLFRYSRGNGESGAVPADTATAALNIARNPHSNVAALFELQPRVSPPFAPSLPSAPADFTLSVTPDDTTVASISDGSQS
ncbi:MAG: hypothetical protein WCA10_11030 [Terracidiphilus sp.]